MPDGTTFSPEHRQAPRNSYVTSLAPYDRMPLTTARGVVAWDIQVVRTAIEASPYPEVAKRAQLVQLDRIAAEIEALLALQVAA